jgi:hypothetical protein
MMSAISVRASSFETVCKLEKGTEDIHRQKKIQAEQDIRLFLEEVDTLLILCKNF